ncbi:MAG TPA: hypothetical protein VM165_00350 [Planctomycetaceae bacterium]|nr:hypothetical protein [Planctomycetaceae bacterium]
MTISSREHSNNAKSNMAGCDIGCISALKLPTSAARRQRQRQTIGDAVFDVVIRGGEVIDGTRAARFRADVGVVGERITAVGDLRDAGARTQLNAAGRIVAPGFIDVHNHCDGWLLREPIFVPKLRQGFTTELLVSDGIGYAPVDAVTAPQWFFYLRCLNALRLDEYRGWESLAEYHQRMDRRTASNTLVQVPYANVRTLLCGFGRGPSTTCSGS